MTEGPVKSKAIKRSTIIAVLVFAAFGALLLRILMIQTVSFDKYQSKVINQMTTESAVPASRGKIYDRNGNVLATNITTYRVFVSPSSISKAEQETGKKYTDAISKGLSELLSDEGVTYNKVYDQITKYTDKLDRTIEQKVYEEKADEIREFIDANELQNMVYLEAQSTRYYPGNSLAAHVLGFTSNDSVGLYGLELQYDEYLSGVDGYYIRARDSYGNVMPFEYASYIDAIDGYNLNTTIDSTIQSYLEEELAATVEKHAANNRACGIVMDVNTGAILAMATSSPFNLNEPRTLDEISQSKFDALLTDGYTPTDEEYNELSQAFLTTMWSNKAVTESYIPGSTFKIITSSMALEESLLSLTESVNCPGYKEYSWAKNGRVKCHETHGHGIISFAQGLQQSCNVWFMTLGERIGIDKYQKYAETFGYTEKTGIDLPGEGNSIFASEMTFPDLVIYAFGQNFNVTALQQLCAISSVANGGTLYTPYLVESVTDNAGNVIYKHQTTAKRATVSAETCETISKILEEGVSGDGGAKNAYVAGYRVAAKTGTSEKKERECPRCDYAGVSKTIETEVDGEIVKEVRYVCSVCKYEGEIDEFEESEEYICSTVAYAPADDPQIAIIIIVDEPEQGSLYGSTVAAPYVANVLENAMPYLGIEARYTPEELEDMKTTVGSYRGWSVERATETIENKGLKYKVIGDGEDVTAQMPAAGSEIEYGSATIVLYAGETPQENVTMPNLTGMIATTANQTLINLSLNIRIEGSDSYLSGTGYKVIAQSVEPGTKVKPGTVITVTFGKSD